MKRVHQSSQGSLYVSIKSQCKKTEKKGRKEK